MSVLSHCPDRTALVHFDPPGAPSISTGHGIDTDPKWKASSLAATAPEPLRGVFKVRPTATQKNAGPLQAWFGLDAQGLAARGVSVGMQVTSDKRGVRLGRTRFTARAEDDRAGHQGLRAARVQFAAWLSIANRAEWRIPDDVKRSHPKASVLKGGRVVFNIKGNDYRLVAAVNYRAGVLAIRFFGTHAEYDSIDVETI